MSFDDRLKDLLRRSIDAPDVADPDALTEELVNRLEAVGPGGGGGPTDGGIFGGTLFWTAGLALVAGLALGVVLGLLGDDPVEATGSILPLDGVPIYSCPAETRVGSLYRGDEILILGRSPSANWLAIRNVRGRGETVYIEAASVLADADVASLPEKDCDRDLIVAVADPGSSTTSTSPTDTTTTAETTSSTGPPTTDTTGTTATTAPPDTTAPSMSQPTATPTQIWEQNSQVISCPPATPRESTIQVTVTDQVGVTSVTASWTIGGNNEVAILTNTSGNVWSATFGPYPADTVPENPPSYETPITITIQARDAAGNLSTRTVNVIVTNIAQCFG